MPSTLRTTTVTAVNGESLRITQCRDCGQDAAWRQSRRTGHWYLAQIADYQTSSENSRTVTRAYPWALHECFDSGQAVAEDERIRAEKVRVIGVLRRMIEKLTQLDDPDLAAIAEDQATVDALVAEITATGDTGSTS